jgi:hypothetical protein
MRKINHVFVRDSGSFIAGNPAQTSSSYVDDTTTSRLTWTSYSLTSDGYFVDKYTLLNLSIVKLVVGVPVISPTVALRATPTLVLAVKATVDAV